MINVGIFCGGFSSEYEISIKSATVILENISSKYNAFLVKVTKKGWTAVYKGEDCIVRIEDFSFTTKNNETIKIALAQVYIHGNPGENGKLQAYFEMKGLPYINSNSISSALSFDKWFCNQFLKSFGIPVAKSILLTHKTEYTPDHIGTELQFPLFVKPADSGSSYGISKVYKIDDLQIAIDDAFKEGATVICESFLKGTEVTCGVYRDNDGIHALPCTEIISESDFFDYEAKYLGKSEEITPARISEEITLKIQERTKEIYQLLQMRSLARVDFMIVNEIPYVIEVNSTPGFTQASLVPKMLAYAGISIQTFWENIYDFESK